ncbi:diaminohydroxyphosphoribosylamino-pyrimidine deaminase [Apiospora arundinis]|uniref:Diaminohydroxyphosphoribosylamino-pyrimidine deaminase n=1 Tax=Apiospora arundinis TaxID=335852 RepID=A0ABR2IWB0_9PEZI
MATQLLFSLLGPEVEDADEETFLLFSQEIPSQNLGFVDARSSSLDLTVAGKDYVIHQSPAVLSSNRAGGTTGAVLWKVTPMFADWISSPANPLWKTGVLAPTSTVIELGCGISGLTGMVLAQSVSRYVLTDQPYVSKWIDTNLAENSANLSAPGTATRRRKGKGAAAPPSGNVAFTPLDWELDEVTSSLTGSDAVRSFDVVIACDCIYNDALIRPLVQTCVDVCKLRASADEAAESRQPQKEPTLCIVAQQLRDPEIFEGWIKEFHRHFHTWRIPESHLSDALRSNYGFVIHVGILRTTPLESHY